MPELNISKEDWGLNVFAKCACHAHAVEVSWFKCINGTYDDAIYLNCWYHGHQGYTLWERVKMAWRVLLGRTEDVEQIILDRDEARQFGETLVRAAEELPHSEAIPQVDPNSSNLDDLFAWGEAVARRTGLTKERSRELLRSVRRKAHEPWYDQEGHLSGAD